MRKSLVIGTTTLALLFGGTGIASATETAIPASTTTTVAQQEAEQEDGDNTGLWGLAGLLGLLGLAGLKRRKDTDVRVAPHTGTGNPRV
ncbi:MYXO-CTERM domain-containing protein [Mycolicibacterium iranicum]|uniref:MYXO-CTERM domain-containing protein n=1 Tax=Mycolicibacterium iranicum TaxID=912594 RepID=A0A839Q7E4_MYCIR|nr:WGxxGxxG family protein [Mycolicibacterium iranicum]MBB2991567.1 MYXO-CTERM domain-containing protein [Mycolicibacterium iranicum]